MSGFASRFSSTNGRQTGTWHLHSGEAVTLRPSQSGVLWVGAGSLWATMDGPHRGAGNDRGDRVLPAGERVSLKAGERIVLEPLGSQARFGWDPLPPWPARRHSASALLWRAALLLPALALTAAMWLGAAVESAGHRADVEAPIRWSVVATQAAAAKCTTGVPRAAPSRPPA